MGHQEDLRERGFTIATEDELGFPGLHEKIAGAFFNTDALPPRPDIEGPVPTRYRNKDFMHYRRTGEAVGLRETSDDRYARIRVDGSPPWRPIPRFRWTDVPGAAEVAAALLRMVPAEDRHEEGTFGLHGFRSFRQVVAEPHADGFEFGGTYVVGRTTGGAVSYLYDMRQDGKLVLEHQLQPGEMLLFHERHPGQPPMFLHGATALDEGGHRDALVIQFDAPEDLTAAADERADLGGAW
jgi:hypothetical protein